MHFKTTNGDNHEPIQLCNSYDPMGKIPDTREIVLLDKKQDQLSLSPSPSPNNNTININNNKICSNFLAPTRQRYPSSTASESNSNTISVCAESIAAVKVDGASHNSINSRTSLSLLISSPSGECIRTKAVVGTFYNSFILSKSNIFKENRLRYGAQFLLSVVLFLRAMIFKDC